MRPKDADGTVSSVDLGQTGLLRALWVCTVAQTYLPQYCQIGYLTVAQIFCVVGGSGTIVV